MSLLLWSLIYISFVSAQEMPQDAEFLTNFLAGRYVVIGKTADSNYVYSGSVSLRPQKENIQIVRKIGNSQVFAKGKIESALAGEQKVLRIYFRQDSVCMEGTFLIHSDLDNYPRLTGYIYKKNKKTTVPGMETWFSKH